MRRLLALLLAFVPVPALAGVGVVPNAAVGSSLVAKSIGADLYDVNVVSGASAGYVLVLDSKTVPGNVAVTPALCLPLAANTGIDINLRAAPMLFQTGIVVLFSTTGCYLNTASATAFIAASAQ
jgi:hypothetical protein